MSFMQILKQPFPHDPSPKKKLGMAASFGLFVFLFLLIFQPFDLDQAAMKRLTFISLMYGMITFGCVFLATIIVPLLSPSSFHEDSWTTGKQILFTGGVIFLVGLANYFFSSILIGTEMTFSKAVWFQGITLAIGLLPVSIFILVKQNSLLKKFSGEAEIIEKKLHKKQEFTTTTASEVKDLTSTEMVFIGDYQNEEIELYPDDLHFITSANNYIKIFHLQKGKLIYSIIRSTLKKAEETVLLHPNFFKCHRAFIVNLDKVVHVEGNAQGYKIKIEGHDALIPVSRNLNSEFSDKLLAFRNQAS